MPKDDSPLLLPNICFVQFVLVLVRTYFGCFSHLQWTAGKLQMSLSSNVREKLK